MNLDLANGRDLVTALLPELILSVWAMLLLLHAAWRHKEPDAQRQVGWLSLVGIIIAAGSVMWLWVSGARIEGIATSVAVDKWRWAGSLIVLIGTGLTTVLAIGYLEREDLRIPEFHVMVLFAAIGMLFLVGGSDLFVIFLGLELMSVSVYVLAGINRRSIVSAEAALKYFLLGAFASAFFLYGIALVYGATGSTKLQVITFQAPVTTGSAQLMLLAGIAMLCIGFGFKVAAVPFHQWAPDVYDGAPTPVTVFMAATVKAAAFAAFVRVMLQALGLVHQDWDQVIWWLAAATMVVGNLIALAQRSVKRMLAYSSVAHAGYLLTGLVPGSAAGAAASLFYLLFYTVVTAAAFSVLIAKGRRGEREVTFDDLAGLAQSDRLLAFVMAVSMLSLLGFPGTAGFMGKWYILTSATGGGYPMLAALLVITSVVSAGYYLPIIMAMYMKSRAHERAHEGVQLPGVVRGMLVAATAIILVFGVWPNRALDLAREGSHSFMPSRIVPLATPLAAPLSPHR